MIKAFKDIFSVLIILGLWSYSLQSIDLSANYFFVSDYCFKLSLEDFYYTRVRHESRRRFSTLDDKPIVGEDGYYTGGSVTNRDWMKSKRNSLATPGPCTIEKRSGEEMSQEIFLDEYAFQKPVVIVNATDYQEFRNLTSYENLISKYGHTIVRLSSANSYSYDSLEISFEDYCLHYLHPQSLSTFGNETFYFFGDNNNEDWFDLLDQYKYPPYSIPKHLPQLSFGIAGPGSGVPFHFHGPGFAETLWGRKRWFLYPPGFIPRFHPNETTLQWLHREYPSSKADPEFSECTLNPGELIYFPDHWWHATLNIDTTVFMSTFLSP